MTSPTPQPTIASLMDQAVRHHQAGRLQQAEMLYRQILSSEPHHAEALHLLGVLAHQVGQNETALELIGRAIHITPGIAAFHCNLGNVYQQMGSIDEAIAAFRSAIALRSEFVEAHSNLANALLLLDRLDEAIASAREATNLNSNYPEAYNTLGSALRKKGVFDESIASLHMALSLKPNYAEALNNLGNAYCDTDHFEQAVEVLQRAIKLKPELAEIHYNLAQSLLGAGKFDPGWKEYEWRKQNLQIPMHRGLRQPEWDGGDLTGRRILLHTEQGFGDAIQFVRYIGQVLERNPAETILICPRELFRLFQSFCPHVRIISFAEPLPIFDVQAPLMSLPYLFHTTLETIPGKIPYLRTEAELVSRWRARIEKQSQPALKVGLCWRGRAKPNPRRSIPSTELAPLAQVRNISLVSLQAAGGAIPPQGTETPPGIKLLDWTDELTDFAETAALIENLDLVISIDTAIAHVAGAMGKPVWLLLPVGADWRWLLNRADSPWYPTMRIFRQEKAGDWNPVIQDIVQRLGELKITS